VVPLLEALPYFTPPVAGVHSVTFTIGMDINSNKPSFDVLSLNELPFITMIVIKVPSFIFHYETLIHKKGLI
jgi:hypothetical protein